MALSEIDAAHFNEDAVLEQRIKEASGNLGGLKPSQKRALSRLLLRRVAPSKLVSIELGRELSRLSADIGRQIGVLLDRQGRVAEAFVGEPTRIFLPDLGRARVSLRHFRGLRHVHTVLQAPGLHRDDLADLQKLRLDCVAALSVDKDGEPGALQFATINPGATLRRESHPYRLQDAASLHVLDIDFDATIAALEDEQARLARTRRAVGAERALVLGVYPDKATSIWRLRELAELAATAGVEVADTLIQIRNQVDGRYVVGSGKLQEAVLRALDVDASLLIVDHSLTPAQARGIAAAADIKVLDRTQLILDIFAQHAQSRDGKLQVELAQLKYTLPRLTDLDAGLSRLSGGIGGRGPGETKLEINRRRARDRITKLERGIAELSAQRGLRRAQRERSQAKVVSIVGYTNAGKSTLLRALTGAQVLVADQLFATLDPTTRRLQLGPEQACTLTDTVGFIRELPADLVRAFRATLEELEGADLLLHVVDACDPRFDDKLASVRQTLADLQLRTIPELVVLNKSDQVEPYVARALCDKHAGVAVSAQSGDGLAALKQSIAARLWDDRANLRQLG